VILTDARYFQSFNKVFREFFGDNPPARICCVADHAGRRVVAKELTEDFIERLKIARIGKDHFNMHHVGQYVSGQTPMKDGEVVEGGIVDQSRLAIQNCVDIMTEADAGRRVVAKELTEDFIERLKIARIGKDHFNMHRQPACPHLLRSGPGGGL
jgi:enamine deaminase RidA (YjgF/YER057c/UK114 family)